MKILHMVPSILIGGVLSVVYNLVAKQRSEGEKVDIYLSRSQSVYRSKEAVFNNIGVNVLSSKYSNNYDPRHVLELRNLMREYDIVHVHLFPLQLWANLAYKSLPDVKRPVMITTEHNTFNNRRNHSIFKIFDRFLYKPYSQIVSISDQTKLNLDNWVGDKKLIEKNIVITNGVDLDKFRNAKGVDLSKVGIPDKVKTVVMVSRLSAPKDPFTLVRAIKECDENIHCIFIGKGDQMGKIKTLAEELSVSQRIHLLGLRDDVPEILKSCDLGVLSTDWDGFGLVSVEYMAAGLPVLVSDVDGLRDVVGNKESLFVRGDYKELAKKISEILTDSNKYDRMKEYSENRCSEFGVEKMREEYYKLYQYLFTNRVNK